MKKTFLIAGIMGAILSTNGYAEIVISQDASDMTVTVARAAKTQARVTPQTTDAQATQENEDLWEDLDFASDSDGGIGMLQCPGRCKLKCKKYGNNTIRCICRGEFGRPCDIIKGISSTAEEELR